MIRLRRAGIAGIASIALTLAAAGCGSDAKLSSSTATTLTAGTVTSASTVPATTLSPGSGTSATTTMAGTDPASTADTGVLTTAPSATGDTSASATVPTTGEVDAGLDDDIFTATADLAAKLKIDAATIETVSATVTEWPNGASGCPKPGMSYTQSPVDGAEIILFAEGKQYSYHEGGSKGPFLCEPTTA